MVLETIRVHTWFRLFESHKWHGQMSTSENYVRTEITEEFISETARQQCYVDNCWHADQRMYHVARQATWGPLYTTGSCRSKGGHQPPWPT